MAGPNGAEVFANSHLDSDVKEVVGDHLCGLRRAPTFTASTLLRINLDIRTFWTDIGIDQLQVVEPRQHVVQQTLDHGRTCSLESVTNF